MIKKLLAWIALILLPGVALAADNQHPYDANGNPQLVILSLAKVQFEAYKLLNYNDPYYAAYKDPQGAAPGSETWNEGIALRTDLDLVRYGDYGMYATMRPHGESTDKQFRAVGLEYELGLRWVDHVDLYYYHHSQHVLDAPGPDGEHFPLQNIYGIRYTMYARDAK